MCLGSWGRCSTINIREPVMRDIVTPDSERVSDLIADLTRDEKLALVSGGVDPDEIATGYLPGIERVGVPPLRFVDGPLGIRVPDEQATTFPASTGLAATFDPELARRQGRALAREALAREIGVVLGPALNLIRVPHCGRNFEYYAEDPILTGAFAAAAVEGIQDAGAIATPKHFVANNQETNRVGVTAQVSERALRECYLPGFHDAVDAGAGAVMTAYNRVNGSYMSEQAHLLGDVLKGEWGFDGFVLSDWYGTESTVGAATAGLDLEMPGVPFWELSGVDMDSLTEFGGDLEAFQGGLPDPSQYDYFGDGLTEALDDRDVPPATLDEMVTRILGQMDRFGMLSDGFDEGALDTEAHRSLASEIAARGTVLLENDGVLPLADDADVALLGPNVHEATLGGGGSSETEPFVETTTVEGISNRADGNVTVCQGVPRIPNLSLFGVPTPDDEQDQDDSAVDLESAVATAADADVAVVVLRDRATEGADREDLSLPGDQDQLVEAVADAAANTVVVLQTSGPVEMPWREEIEALVETWYPGQADGSALAAVLYGDSDPSGRLPVTFAPESEYLTADESAFPGDTEVHYEEGVFVGYRYFDSEGLDPTYPFGHGHSYADFAYRDIELDEGAVRVTIENTASRQGREVVQAYVCPPDCTVPRPERELAGFAAVELEAGESRTVSLDLDRRAFAYYDEGWTVEPGEYGIEVGRSARDIRFAESTKR